MSFQATVIFTTHNRQELLKKAIQAAQSQTVKVKIIVMDDASQDETPRMMSEEFPEIEYHRSHQNLGPCYHRNKGIQVAPTEIVFPLDDDSILQSSYTVEQTLSEFTDSRIGAVTIPFINILQDEMVWTKSPDAQQIFISHTFVAASHAIRKSAFLLAGGYRDSFFYMGEEGDLSIRLLKHGFYIKLGNSDPIHHYQPPNRVSSRADIYGRRNDILFTYLNVPFPYFIPHLLGTTLKGIYFGFKVRRPLYASKGLFQGYCELFKNINLRDPVNINCYKLFRILKKSEPLALDQVRLLLRDVI